MPTNTHPNPIWKAVVTGDMAAHKLTTLLAAAFPTIYIPKTCAQLRVFLDISAAGDLYAGNDDLTTSNWGEHLVSGQYFDSFARDANDFPLQDIYVLSSNGIDRIGVTIFMK